MDEKEKAALMSVTKKATDLVLKAALTAALPGSALIYDVGKLAVSQIVEWSRLRQEQRAAAFHEALIGENGEWSASLENEKIEKADFHALLAACISDIEDEKAPRYAALTRSIVLQQVDVREKRFFITSLKELANADIERLRAALIAAEHDLIPAQGPRFDRSIKRYPGGSHLNFGYEQLVQRGFVEKEGLTELGARFTRACYADSDLTPTSIGKRKFEPIQFWMVTYDIGLPVFQKFYDAYCNAERERGLRSLPAGNVRNAAGQPKYPLGATHGLIVAGERDAARKHLDALREFAARRQSVGIVLPGADATWLKELPLVGILNVEESQLARAGDLLEQAITLLAQAPRTTR